MEIELTITLPTLLVAALSELTNENRTLSDVLYIAAEDYILELDKKCLIDFGELPTACARWINGEFKI